MSDFCNRAASRKLPKIALVHLGASVDVLEVRIADILPETVEQVIDAYPRLGFTAAITQLLVSQVKCKLHTAAFTWLAEVGRNCIHGLVSPSWSQALDRNPFAELQE